jgi:serine/threonine protein kinase
MRYEAYCFADPVFYDSPARWEASGDAFELTDLSVPEGWTRRENGVWVVFHPPELNLPSQGWKIHVSACLDNADDVLAIVSRYCIARNIAFKFLRNRKIMLAHNAKYAPRDSSGKLLTLYPIDEVELERTLIELGAALEDQRGPYILSDLRWRSGPLYVRYGGFVERYCPSEAGELVLAIENPDGQLVPDLREPVFQVPSWVKVPSILAEQLAVEDSDAPGDFPYQIKRPLHYSNAGGVYLAEDTRTGQKVVLKEARPFAGLDRYKVDAVTRLQHERDILEQLSGLEAVPVIFDYLTCWEHRFLVQEHIEGETLHRRFAERYPLIRPDPTRGDLAQYTTWALDVLDQVEQGLEAIHRRGIIFGDLHPHNLMIRRDGRIIFVDFELACHVDEQRRPGLGAPGFAAPDSRSGFDIDHYALACLRLWLFLPLTVLLSRDMTKAEMLVHAAIERFPVPEMFFEQVLRNLCRSQDGNTMSSYTTTQRSAAGLITQIDTMNPDWDTLRKSMVEAILTSATPERPDRLFPGDINQFVYDGTCVAYGAAGVLYALSATGAMLYPQHEDWLVRAVRRGEHHRLGFYDGLHGVAYVLAHLGRHDEANKVLDRAMALPLPTHNFDLFGGLAGIGLNLLHFAHVTGDQCFRDAAIGTAERLEKEVKDRDIVATRSFRPGLMYGFSGPALFFVRLYEETADGRFLDLAASMLRHDLSRCVMTEDETFQVDEGWKVVAYLATGSIGIGLVLHEFLAHRQDEAFVSAQTGITRAARPEFILQPGLFTGRAGFIMYLSQVSGPFQDGPFQETVPKPILDRHLRRLAWHATPYQGHIGFPGDQLLRLSMDLGTGSAGILLALSAALDEEGAFLPFFRRRTIVDPAQPKVPRSRVT